MQGRCICRNKTRYHGNHCFPCKASALAAIPRVSAAAHRTINVNYDHKEQAAPPIYLAIKMNILSTFTQRGILTKLNDIGTAPHTLAKCAHKPSLEFHQQKGGSCRRSCRYPVSGLCGFRSCSTLARTLSPPRGCRTPRRHSRGSAR